MNRFGPPRSEIRFRLWISLMGLVLMVAALLWRGLPSGPAMFEVIVIAGGFFGGTFVWSLMQLRKREDDDGL